MICILKVIHQYCQVLLKTLEKCLLAPGLVWQAALKKTKVGIRRGISQSINRYAKANNKYMK